MQNFPVVTSSFTGGGVVTVAGTLNSTPSTTFRLEFFANSILDPSGFGEGETFVGSATVTTDLSGDASFAVSFPASVPAGQFITATATDPGGNTSEFSGVVTAEPGLTVAIDIKPGDDPNCINLGSGGVVPVAILGGTDLDVSTVDQTTLVLEGSNARVKGKSGNIGSFDDVNGDGFTDLVVQFPTTDLALTEADVEATLTGQLLDGTPIQGTDTICVVPPASKQGVPSEEGGVPERFFLAQNYPNPFNPSTEIRFDLPEAAEVQLVVYDVTGREVAQLVDQPMDAGIHAVTWDASGLPSGTYLYRLTAGPFTETKAMALLK